MEADETHKKNERQGFAPVPLRNSNLKLNL